MAIDWSLGINRTNPINALMQGMEQGNALRMQREDRALQQEDRAFNRQRILQQDQRQATMDARQIKREDADDQRQAAMMKLRERAADVETTMQQLTYLRNIRDSNPQDFGSAVMAAIPIFDQMAGSPEEKAQTDELIKAITANPAALDGVLGEVEKAWQFINMGDNGLARGNNRTGQLEVLREPRPTQEQGRWVERTKPDGSTEWFQLPTDGGSIGGTGAGGPLVPIEQVEAMLTQAIPGLVVTGRDRTPERNAQVNGVPNSYHLTGQARDLRIPPGQTPQQFAAVVQRALPPGYEAIAENNPPHVHVEPRPGVVRPARQTTVAGDAPKPEKPEMTPKQQADMSLRVLGQFKNEPDVKDYNVIATAYQQINRLANKPNPTAADDMALTYSFMKINDPTSVVRETEFAMVGRTAGLPDQVVMALDGLQNGKRLTPQIRQQLVGAAQAMFQERQARYNQLVGQYETLGSQAGVLPGTIQRRIDPPQAAARPRPSGAASGSGQTQPGGRGGRGGAAQPSRVLRYNPQTGKIE